MAIVAHVSTVICANTKMFMKLCDGTNFRQWQLFESGYVTVPTHKITCC